jgi:L-alanine-DL-glutamate epimerase-like enolase superfamily enzyme
MALRLVAIPYPLTLRRPFTISGHSRTHTPAVLTELHFEGQVGYGEASMPPYLGETVQSAMDFLGKVDLSPFRSPYLMEDILCYVDSVMPGNCAAKASVDIALHDLVGKLLGAPWHRLWGLDPLKAPMTSYTIGMDTPQVVQEKTLEAPYEVLKVKLGTEQDKQLVQAIRAVSNKPITVDANQGWKDKRHALEMVQWLHQQGVIFVEQPMPKDNLEDIAWLTERSPLPIMADESVQRLADLEKLRGVFSGVNIKLMKCTGMREAWKMINLAKSFNMKVMMGCMTETSCGISAAAQLSPLCDWADLDGNVLISNDCFDGMKVVNGKIVLDDRPGIGVTKLN